MSALEKLGYDESSHKKIDISQEQNQTKEIFGFKWSKRDTYDSVNVQATVRNWMVERYLAGQPEKLAELLGNSPKIILDAGCGSGFSGMLFFEDFLDKHDYLGIDISNAVEVARQRFAEKGVKGDFLQTSLMDLPFSDESIDIIFSEGVLHHTDSTENAILYLSKKLKQGGKFMFYVYAKKAVIREFTDDYVREAIKHMTDEEAWKALEPLTKLGVTLGELNMDIDVPEDIDFLGIKKGKLNLQRFFYWNIMKIFYRPEYTLDEMNHVNFDWFRPMNCQRHTPEEVENYCKRAGLSIEHINIQEAGITVVATKI